MRKILCSGIIILSVMLILPLTVIKKPQRTVTASTAAEKIPVAKKAVADKFLVCNTEDGSVTEMPAKDYIFGVVAAEMPALYETEALKAQAVAAYTYACFRRAENSDKSYDITTDHTTDQSFITKEKAAEKWGDNANEYCEKIENAIREVENQMITYKGKPILSVFHSLSGGKTENSADIWGKDLPYLRAVSSPYDKLSPGYISTVTVSESDFKSTLSEECDFSGAPQDYIKNTECTKSGTVKNLSICGSEIKGAKIRSLFSLRSANFKVEYKENNFNFTVYGYGHGVGMSQYGADYMAKQGSDYKEILKHYYTDCKIEKIS